MRIKNKITMDELSLKSRVSQKHVSNIKNHKATPTVETLNKIANALGADIQLTINKHSFQMAKEVV
ncbi:helix-turn-helix domain-containing protein [Clostridium sp. BJN0013]|uniref:helix-turn-helix domain-containing protein n=1 Tax=Clostridium sp. BJN0013 TaxID=3236840 RepID=UPI0034C6B0D5